MHCVWQCGIVAHWSLLSIFPPLLSCPPRSLALPGSAPTVFGLETMQLPAASGKKLNARYFEYSPTQPTRSTPPTDQTRAETLRFLPCKAAGS